MEDESGLIYQISSTRYPFDTPHVITRKPLNIGEPIKIPDFHGRPNLEIKAISPRLVRIKESDAYNGTKFALRGAIHNYAVKSRKPDTWLGAKFLVLYRTEWNKWVTPLEALSREELDALGWFDQENPPKAKHVYYASEQSQTRITGFNFLSPLSIGQPETGTTGGKYKERKVEVEVLHYPRGYIIADRLDRKLANRLQPLTAPIVRRVGSNETYTARHGRLIFTQKES